LAYLLGALYAIIVGATFDLYKFVFVYVILFTGTLSAMYNNNYNDVNIDKNSKQTIFSGGSHILVEHPELMKIVKQLSIFFLGLSIFLGFVAMVLFSYPITFFLFVLFGNLAGWYYTAPPIKLVYRGLGEIGTMLAAGLFVPGLGYFALAGTIDAPFILLLIPLLFYGFGLSFYLEIPDIEADRQGNKKTLVVRRGLSFGFLAGAISSFFTTLCFLIFGLFNFITDDINYWLVAFFSLIPFYFCFKNLIKYKADKINSLVFRSSASIFLFYILLIVYFTYLIFYI
jgi:1,4-dihydroxy-2-naphthoate octaprenyltransferase